jgi:hypothetical protein
VLLVGASREGSCCFGSVVPGQRCGEAGGSTDLAGAERIATGGDRGIEIETAFDSRRWTRCGADAEIRAASRVELFLLLTAWLYRAPVSALISGRMRTACPLMMIPLRALLAESVSAIDGSRNAAEVDDTGGSSITVACMGFLFLYLGYLQIWPSRR